MGANHPNVAWPAHEDELQQLAALLGITGVQANYMQLLRPATSSSLDSNALLCLLLALPATCLLRV